MPRRRDSDSGRFTEAYSDEQVLDLLKDGRLATSEVADRLDCHRTTAHSRLVALESRGEVKRTQVGNTYLWSLSGEQ